jgi:hypothetical protein
MDRTEPQSAGAAGDGFRMVIPTRDSAPWIVALAQAYERVGVRPLFVVDSRSSDGTCGELHRAGADVVEVLPVERTIRRAPSLRSASTVDITSRCC